MWIKRTVCLGELIKAIYLYFIPFTVDVKLEMHFYSELPFLLICYIIDFQGEYKSHGLSTNNCRLENVKKSGLYSPILKAGRRCVIAVEGFYEWQTTDQSSKVKQPYYIYAQQEEGVEVLYFSEIALFFLCIS